MRKSNIVLILIVLLGLFLRIVALGTVPSGFSPDEASQAYTAYSLLKTGKDEWGTSWPISSFKSFLDYKSPLQTYLMIPTIAVFGLNEFGARLPSAIFGTLAIIVVYLLANKLFKGKKYRIGNLELNIGHLAAFLLAISPWHLQFSRTALEVNLSSFFFPIGLFFFLEGLEKPVKLIYTAIFWSLGLYTYHAAFIFIPLFGLTVTIEYWKTLKKFIPSLVLPSVVLAIICIPILFNTFFGSAGKRGNDLLITTLSQDDKSTIDNQTFYSKLNKISPKLPRIFHNQLVFTFSEFIQNYISYFTPSFWFTEGGREITYSVIPGRGLLYFWMYPLIILALFNIIKEKENHKYLKIILPWLVFAALPAALTKEGYRPNRAGSFLVIWELLAAYGLIAVTDLKFKFKKIVVISFSLLSLILVIFYFEDYFFASSANYPTAISFGWRDTINFVKQVQDQYTTVVVERGSEPQSFIAFYLKYDPILFQKSASDWNQLILKQDKIEYLDQIGNYQLGKYQFRALNWPEDIQKKTLFVSHPDQLLPKNRRILKKIDSSGQEVFEIFDFN